MSVVVHTKACQDERLRVWAVQSVFSATHPRHCRSCQGYGVMDSSDPEVGLRGWEPCGDCVGAGRCPRCGGAVSALGEEGEFVGGRCAACRFDFQPAEGDDYALANGEQGLPELHTLTGPCACEVAVWEAQERAEASAAFDREAQRQGDAEEAAEYERLVTETS